MMLSRDFYKLRDACPVMRLSLLQLIPALGMLLYTSVLGTGVSESRKLENIYAPKYDLIAIPNALLSVHHPVYWNMK